MATFTRFGLVAVSAVFLLVAAPAAASAQSWGDAAVEQEAPEQPVGDQDTYGRAYEQPNLPIVTPVDESTPRLSSDANWLVYTSDRLGADDILLYGLDSGMVDE
ncbi:hypothetical protein GCM10022226_83240 [Sphaerisporangium flaviroseum]|uniref:S9 family peptidase n=1 Tax=Sphaerisporangium flaviroseum TaxID=509199 RepID=A0ABP7JK85_9ACTN